MRRKALYTLSLSIVLCLVSVASLYAQGSREISGTVQDAASKLPPELRFRIGTCRP